MDWKKIKNDEMQYLLGEYNKDPHLFEMETFVDSPEFLREFGIAIPGKEKFPNAYVKFFPQDFIVEEITPDGTLLTADKETNITQDKNEEFKGTVYATLVKCNLATFDAVKEISRQLNLKPEQIKYAGIKDKGAITSQRLSIRGSAKEDVEKIESDYFFLKDITEGKGAMDVGGLKGNRFTILLRTEFPLETDGRKDDVLQAYDKVMKDGFYNFYYLQRFASPRLTNYKWGYHVLRGEYEDAVRERLFEPGLRESKYFQALRQELAQYHGDWKKVKEGFSPFPIICRQEHAVLDHLLVNPDDFVGALNQIPDQVKMWVYALEALLYNQLLSNNLFRGTLPETLPMCINNKPSHWEPYEEELKGLDIYPPPIKNLYPFSIRLAAPMMETRHKANVHNIKIVPEGVVIQFDLAKGDYATTFLSHMFNLLSGKPTESMSREPSDIKNVLGDPSFAPTLETFAEITKPKVDNFIDLFKDGE